MGTFFVYILKAAVCLSAFYLFYRLLLARETFHRFNRFAVLGILLASLVIPFCEVRITGQSEVHQTMLSIEQLLLMADLMNNSPAVEAQKEHATWVHILLFAYLAGIFFFVCRNIYSLIRLAVLLKSGERRKLEGHISLIIHHKNNLAPFSWIRYVVISRRDLEENGSEILIHELAHICKRHSIDLLIADICIFFQWFNPAAWLLKQELQNIHEYEADEAVLKEGIDAKQYQLLIIKKAVGTRLYSMANGFNHSKLKKRITMMLKEKSSPWAKLKYLYVLPLAAIAVSAFARPEISNELKEISDIKVNDLTAIVIANADEKQSMEQESIPLEYKVKQTKVPQNKEQSRPEEQNAESSSLQNKIHWLKDDKKPLVIIDGKESTLTVMQSILPDRIKSIDVLKDESATELYGGKGADGVIIINLKGVDETTNPAIKIKAPFADQLNMQIKERPLIIVDGRKMEFKEKIDPATIESIAVLKDVSLAKGEEKRIIDLYPEDAKAGAIFITLKRPGDGTGIQLKTVVRAQSISKKGETIAVDGRVTDQAGKPVVGAAIIIQETNLGTISDLDGNFRLNAPEGSMLQISFIDMKTSTVKAAETVAVELIPE